MQSKSMKVIIWSRQQKGNDKDVGYKVYYGCYIAFMLDQLTEYLHLDWKGVDFI